MKSPQLKPIHPGDIIRTELLEVNNLTSEQLAKNIGLEQQVIDELLAERGKITPDLALRLSIYFEVSPEFFLNLQQRYDLKVLKSKQEAWLRKIIRPYQAPASSNYVKK